MSELIETVNPNMPRGYEALSGVRITQQKDGVLRYDGLLELGEGDDRIVRMVQLPELDQIFHDQSLEPSQPDPDHESALIKDEILADVKAMLSSIVEAPLAAMAARLDELEKTNKALAAENRQQKEQIDKLLKELEEARAANPNETRTEDNLVVETPPAAEPTTAETTEITGTQYQYPADGSRWQRGKVWVGETISGRRAHAGLMRVTERGGRRYRIVEEEIGPDGYVESDSRSGARALGAVALAAVAGALLWELWEHKIHGHSTSREIREAVQGQIAAHEHADKLRDAANHKAEMQAIGGINNHLHHLQDTMTRQHVHDHYHELRAIHGNETGPSSYYPHINHGVHTTSGTDYGYGTPTGPNHASHLQYINGNSGHKLTGVELPKNLKLAHNTAGGYSLTDTRGNRIINRLEWDRQGNLSTSTRAALKAKGYSLTQGALGRRYITEVSVS